MAIIVYTAVTAGYDSLRTPPPRLQREADFVAFLEPLTPVNGWQPRPLDSHYGDANRNAKRYKILPHHYFLQYDFSLWIDGTIELAFDFPICQLTAYLGDADIALRAHPRRCCAYQEASHCIQDRLDDRETIYRQVGRYTRDGFPANMGLVNASVILRRHTPRVVEFCEKWWQEIVQGSRRDQISFPYVAWKCGLKYSSFPEGLFKCHPHTNPARRKLPASGSQPCSLGGAD